MRKYLLSQVRSELEPGTVFEPAHWCHAETAAVDVFPWFMSGLKQRTEVRLVYDKDALHLLFEAQDIHSYAGKRELNGRVYLDSCVEFFASPWPDDTPDYFNCEINCCGAIHFGFGPDRYNRRLISPALAEDILVLSTIAGDAKKEFQDDSGWKVYVRLPRKTLSALCGRSVGFSGMWRGNFHRCGGRTEPQFACWNPIDSPNPDYHRPEQFGELMFNLDIA